METYRVTESIFEKMDETLEDDARGDGKPKLPPTKDGLRDIKDFEEIQFEMRRGNLTPAIVELRGEIEAEKHFDDPERLQLYEETLAKLEDRDP